MKIEFCPDVGVQYCTFFRFHLSVNRWKSAFFVIVHQLNEGVVTFQEIFMVIVSLLLIELF